MRIVHSVMTAGLGGTERYAADLANAQARDGHDVAVLMRARRFKASPNVFADWLDERVQIYQAPCRWPLFAMRRAMKQHRLDVLHTHHARDARYAAKLAPNAIRVATLHSGDYEARLYASHHRIIAITPDQLTRIPQQAQARSVFIPNWLPKAAPFNEVQKMAKTLQLAWGTQADKRPILGTATRLAFQKGLDRLIEAYARLSHRDWRMVIMGEGAEEPKLRALIAKYSLQNDVLLAGLIDPAEAGYGLFDAFVLPSRWENFGLVLLEAMRAQLPIIATRCDGPLSILSDSPKVHWAQPDDVESLKQALEELFNSETQKPTIYEALSRYTFDTIYAQTMQQYERA